VSLRDVLPNLFGSDEANRASVDFKHLAEFKWGQRALTDKSDIIFSKFGPRASFSGHHLSSFPCILGVIRDSSGTQMGWLATRWPIAGMKNDQSIRNDADEFSVCNLMCPDHGWLVIDYHAELAISMRIGRCWPVPTTFGWRGCEGWVAWHKPGEGFNFVQSLRTPNTSATQGISMTKKSVVMRPTQATSSGFIKATRNRAIHAPKYRGRSS